MGGQSGRLSGDEWQEWANQLLTCHHGPTDYQKVPDKDRGDAGLEGFCHSQGAVYQAYGCDEPIGVAERYKKQRDKMTADVGKFIKNRATLGKLFGTLKIRRWVLLVPCFDSKELVAHAAVKTAEVKAEKLPYVADDFCIVVCQEDDFVVERDRLLNAGASYIEIITEVATPEKLSNWSATNDALLETLEMKLSKLPKLQIASERAAFKRKVLGWYIEGQSVLEGLRKYPQVYERVIRSKAHRENYLAMAAVGGSASHELLTQAVTDLRDTLQQEAKELHHFSADKLAHEAVADWLLRCPLDFPEMASA